MCLCTKCIYTSHYESSMRVTGKGIQRNYEFFMGFITNQNETDVLSFYGLQSEVQYTVKKCMLQVIYVLDFINSED